MIGGSLSNIALPVNNQISASFS